MMKIKAFTILEMIINLALMGIIVSMVYLVYLYFSKNMSDYADITTENFSTRSFFTLLKEDFYLSDRIISENGKDFKAITYDEKEVSYIQANNYLYRRVSSIKDSIPLRNIIIKYLRENETINNTNPIKSITIKTLILEQEVDLFISKYYFSDHIFLEE